MRLGEGGELRDERVACEAVGRGKSAGGGIEEQEGLWHLGRTDVGERIENNDGKLVFLG